MAICLSFPAVGTTYAQELPPLEMAVEQVQGSTAVPDPSSPSAKDGAKDTTNDSAKPTPPPEAKKAIPKKRRRPTRPRASADPRKVVVPEGGAKEPPAQIAPGLAPDEADRQRRDAEQWLSSADGQLKTLAGRTLGMQQQEALGQARNYMTGARLALKEGDMRRASTLALKAHLLAEDLVRR